MRKRNNPISMLVLAIFFLGLSMIMIYASSANAAEGDAVALKDGECVIETINGDMYVGKAIHLSSFEKFVIVKDVRYPEVIIGLMIPASRIIKIYTFSKTKSKIEN